MRSDAICFYWNEWMEIDCSFCRQYKSCPVKYKSCQRESKIKYYSCFKSWTKPINSSRSEVYNLYAREARVYHTSIARPTCRGFFHMWIITMFMVGESPPNISGKWKRTANSTTVDSTSGWDWSSLGLIYKQNSARPRKSTLNSGRATAQRRQTLSAKDRGCKEAATK